MGPRSAYPPHVLFRLLVVASRHSPPRLAHPGTAPCSSSMSLVVDRLSSRPRSRWCSQYCTCSDSCRQVLGTISSPLPPRLSALVLSPSTTCRPPDYLRRLSYSCCPGASPGPTFGCPEHDSSYSQNQRSPGSARSRL